MLQLWCLSATLSEIIKKNQCVLIETQLFLMCVIDGVHCMVLLKECAFLNAPENVDLYGSAQFTKNTRMIY